MHKQKIIAAALAINKMTAKASSLDHVWDNKRKVWIPNKWRTAKPVFQAVTFHTIKIS